MAPLRRLLVLPGVLALLILGACAGPRAPACWRSPPEPDPRNPADYVAWAQACAREGLTDNAWDIYQRLIERTPTAEAKELLQIGYAVRWPWEEERFAAAAEWIERADETFGLLRQASAHRQLYVPLEPDGPYLLRITSASRKPIRVAARGLAAAGWRKFFQGDPTQLRRDAVVLLRVAHHLDQATTPTGRLGRGAFVRMLYRDVMLQLLERSDDPGRLAAELLGAFREADPPARWLDRMVMMQYAALADMYQRIYRWDERSGRLVMERAEIEPLRARFRRLREAGEEEITEKLLPSDYHASIAFIKAHHRKLAECVDKPWVDCSAGIRELDEAVAREGTYLTQATVRKLSRFLLERRQTETARRATHLVYAIWAHRHNRGSFPESLDELAVPDLSELRCDPFSSGDFAYRPTPQGFVLYTPGVDGADQGGAHREDWGATEPGDYVFWPVQPVTPPWLRPRILITSDGRILEQPRDGGPPREISPEDLGLSRPGDADSQGPERRPTHAPSTRPTTSPSGR